MKLKYHLPGINKNKEIKRLRNHPLPALLMAHYPLNDGVQGEIRGIGTNIRRNNKNKNNSEIV